MKLFLKFVFFPFVLMFSEMGLSDGIDGAAEAEQSVTNEATLAKGGEISPVAQEK